MLSSVVGANRDWFKFVKFVTSAKSNVHRGEIVRVLGVFVLSVSEWFQNDQSGLRRLPK